MYSKNNCVKARRHRRTLAFMLITAMMVIMAIPSFAEDQIEGADTINNETAAQTESEKAEMLDNEKEQVSEDAEKTETEAIQPDEDIHEIKPEEDPVKKGATDEESATDETTYKEEASASEEGESKAEETAEIKKSAPKAKLMKASDSGKKVSFTGEKVGSAAGETTIFKVTSDGTSFTGTCAEQGVSMKSSGTATITKISNDKKIAKVIYHYVFELGDDNWWTGDGKTDKVGKLLGMNNDNDTNVTKRRMVEAFCQIYHMGSSDWYNTITNAATGGWDDRTADRVRDFYSGISDKNWYNDLTVPDGFEIWLADPGNSQPFMIWAYNPTGYVTLKKISADTSITG